MSELSQEQTPVASAYPAGEGEGQRGQEASGGSGFQECQPGERAAPGQTAPQPSPQGTQGDGTALPERLQAAIDRLPQVQQARQQAQAARREAEQLQAKLKVEEQLRQIAQLDPTVKSLSDLTRQPNYKTLYRLVQKGNTLTDAYKLANYDALIQSAAAASRQAAVNAATGKNHLQQTTTRGAGAVQVPAEVRELYRAFNPGVTDSEIQAHYAKRKRT